MARKNNTRLCGRVVYIKKNEEDETIRLSIEVPRETNKRHDIIDVRVFPDAYYNFELIKVEDFVTVKGYMSSSVDDGTMSCPKKNAAGQVCGAAIPDVFDEVYVVGLAAMVNQGYYLMDYLKPFGNEGDYLGKVIGKVTTKTLMSGEQNTTFRVRISKIYNREVDGDRTHDIIYVTTLGERAVEDAKRLKYGSIVLITGAVQERTIYSERTCPVCGGITLVPKKTLEILSGITEYLNNCNF